MEPKPPNESPEADPLGPFTKCAEVLARVGGQSVLNSLRQAYATASDIDKRFHECTWFSLLNDAELKKLRLHDSQWEAIWVWRQVLQLLVLSVRTSSRSFRSLIEGVAWSLGQRSELPLALTVRSMIEHASALHFLSSRCSPHSGRLAKQIWPNLSRQDQLPPLTSEDREVFSELFRFCLGHQTERLDVSEIPSPDESSRQWRRYYDDIYQRIRDVPERFRPREVRDYLGEVRNIAGAQQFRAIYNRLCEYCHPNSASRCLDFHILDTDHGETKLRDSSDAVLNSGFIELLELTLTVLPTACELASNSLKKLTSCIAPMKPLGEGTSSKPTIGSRCAVDFFGRLFWVSSDVIAQPTGKPVGVLTPRQEQRVRALHSLFGPVEGSTIQDWLDDMLREGPNVEAELALWENFAQIFRREASERPNASLYEKQLLRMALTQGIESGSIDDLLNACPELKALPNLERVFLRLWAKPNVK